MGKFRKKPVVVEAVQLRAYDFPAELQHAVQDGRITPLPDGGCLIQTLEGPLLGRIGDWVIQGVNGELYPCKPDIFDKTYEAAE